MRGARRGFGALNHGDGDVLALCIEAFTMDFSYLRYGLFTAHLQLRVLQPFTRRAPWRSECRTRSRVSE